MTLDANVFVRVVVPEELSMQARALWNSLLARGAPCFVPAFCPAEVISSLRQMGRAGHISLVHEQEGVNEFITAIEPVLIPLGYPSLTRAAWELARDLDERHTYDCVYLAIARAFDWEFWTADQVLLRRLAGRIPQARFLGDYPLP